MKLEKITNQHRSDYVEEMVCEHCDAKATDNNGYLDVNYTSRVIPAMHCEKCGKNQAGKQKTVIGYL